MERATPQAPRRVSRLRMMASAVTALLAGQRIEFSGRGSRAMQREAEQLVSQQKMREHNPRLFAHKHYGPVWTGKPRPSFRTPSSRITASY